MPDYYIGDIAIVGFGYATTDFLPCDGRLLPVAQYQALYALIGNTYGGGGQNFALPNLNGQAVVGTGQAPGLTSYVAGQTGGLDNVTLTPTTLPSHTHTVSAVTSNRGSAATPAANVPGPGGTLKPYAAAPDPTIMHPAMLKPVGGGLSHENRQPFLALNFVICVNGLWPPRD
jgi:microcystin-dependent protein